MPEMVESTTGNAERSRGAVAHQERAQAAGQHRVGGGEGEVDELHGQRPKPSAWPLGRRSGTPSRPAVVSRSAGSLQAVGGPAVGTRIRPHCSQVTTVPEGR